MSIMNEMSRRGYNADARWIDGRYRGNSCNPYSEVGACVVRGKIYPEHDDRYLQECIENLKGKGVKIGD